MSVSGAVTKDVYGVTLARACETRYGFLQGPRTVEDFEIQKGVSFFHGNFQGGVVDKFQVFADGFVAEAKANTSYCDEFLDDIILWLKDEAGFQTAKEGQSPRFYYSHLEVKADFALDERLVKLNDVGQQLTNLLRSYGQVHQVNARLTGISFAPTAEAEPYFRFERRVGIAESGRLYYSAAPLRTADHLVLLKYLDDALA